jgi:SPP1 gp7 family putative phage head morphogenesis protein
VSLADDLADLAITRQLVLERLKAGERRELNAQLAAIATEIRRILRNADELSEYQARRLSQIISELKATVSIPGPDIADLANTEARWLRSSAGRIGITAALPPADVIERIATRSLVEGATIGAWFRQLEESLRFDIERVIRNGVILGRTNAQLVKELIGGKGDTGSEPLVKARRNANAIARTATQAIANDTRLAFYEANADVFSGVQWVSTLDNRTSQTCMALSGLVWSLPDYKPEGHSIEWQGPPPAHFNCRSALIGITPSISELTGKARDKIAPRTRASMDGSVAQDISFDDWLRSKPKELADEMLGKGRAELWRDGKITLQQLLDQSGNPLTLEQLKRLYG